MEKKSKGKNVLFYLISAVAGGAIGFGGMALLKGNFAALIVALISFFGSLLVHIVLHEGGHLVCGLLSGYKYVSFRVGSWVFVRRGDKMERKKYSLPGTAGQCLLDPPEPDEEGQFPAVLYNLGGGLSNLFFSFLAVLAAVLAGNFWVNTVLVPFAVVGVYLAAVNLIPLKVDGVANDGANIKVFRENAESRRAFWQQMRINKLETEGVRMKDMPMEYFELPEGDFSGDPLIDAMRIMHFKRLEDEGRFEEARIYGETLLKRDLLQVYRQLLELEMLYLEIIGPCRSEVIESICTAKLRKESVSVKNSPYVHRALYAYGLRYAKLEAMAEKKLENFEKSIGSCPSLGEIETERFLMERIKEVTPR